MDTQGLNIADAITIDLRDEFETKAKNILPVLMRPSEKRQTQQCEIVLNLLKKVEIIKKTFDLQSSAFRSLVKHLKIEIFIERAVIFKKGQEGDYFYIVLIGSCAVKPDSKASDDSNNIKPQIYYYPGKGFGEISLIYDVPRGATVIAEENTTLIKISKQDFKKCMKVQKKLSQMDLYFSQHPFLEMADSFMLRVLASSSIKISFSQGDVIVKEGDFMNYLIFFIKGCVQVSKRIRIKLKNGKIIEKIVKIQQLSENGIFGEQFVISKKPSTYIVKALDRGEYAKVQLQYNINAGDTAFSRRILNTSNRSLSQQQILNSYKCSLYKEVRKIQLLLEIYKEKNKQQFFRKLKLAKSKFKEIEEATLVTEPQEEQEY